MYLPHSVPLARPHVAMWFGQSGKRYDFAVSRARPLWLGQPVVYVLVRYDGDNAVPLFVGRATAADPQLGGAASGAIAAWEQAMALGMTHLHLRFEACTEEDRAAEVEDLVAAIRPPLNEAAALTQDGEEPVAADVPFADMADMAVADGPVAEIAVAEVVAASAQAVAAEAARPAWPGGWLGRTALALAARYRHWRLRAPATAVEAPGGRVTVRADAIAVEGPDSRAAMPALKPATAAELPLTLEIELPAASPAPAPAEPAVAAVAVEADAGDARMAVRRCLGVGAEDIVVLFAGEITRPNGADLVVDAMATVHADPGPVRLLLVGEGPLRAELEGRAWHGGFAHACRFIGDLPAEAFAEVFAACDAVVIPARTAQNPLLAEHTLGAGKLVLTTHQAQLGFVRHGENGLVTYDNPGSLVWGLREIRVLVERRRAPAALAA